MKILGVCHNKVKEYNMISIIREAIPVSVSIWLGTNRNEYFLAERSPRHCFHICPKCVDREKASQYTPLITY